MSSWYRTGTVNVTSGSATVTGVGTDFVANTKVGEEFRLQGGQVGYEITAIVSATEITITPAYLGTTQTGQAFEIVPVRGFLKDAYDAFNAALTTINGYVTGALAGRFGDGSAGQPGISFASDTNTGLYRVAADQIGAVTNGIRRWLLTGTAFQVNVPITGTAVQDDSLDNTTGRLLKVGAFGLGAGGGVAAPNSDADDCIVAGFNYRFPTSGTNCPVANPYGSSLNVFVGTGGNLLQQVFVHSSGSDMWIRSSSDAGDTWSEWRKVFTQGNLLGSVSQSSGVPTGGVIERGGNANGTYVRFADGTQICTHKLTYADITTALGAIFGSALTAWTFPSAFLAGDRPVVAVDTNSTDNWGTVAVPSVTSANLRALSFQSEASGGDFYVQATGRWF